MTFSVSEIWIFFKSNENNVQCFLQRFLMETSSHLSTLLKSGVASFRGSGRPVLKKVWSQLEDRKKESLQVWTSLRSRVEGHYNSGQAHICFVDLPLTFWVQVSYKSLESLFLSLQCIFQQSHVLKMTKKLGNEFREVSTV